MSSNKYASTIICEKQIEINIMFISINVIQHFTLFFKSLNVGRKIIKVYW